jgi:hypothetical protein
VREVLVVDDDPEIRARQTGASHPGVLYMVSRATLSPLNSRMLQV